MSENKNRMSTTELVDIVTSFCEMYSGINFYPYQEQFARRIIRSVLTNDGNEISALFSRQCIPEGELIHTREGGLVKIEDHPDSWVTNESAEVLQISIKGGYTLKCTANHPVMTDRGWLQAGLLKAGDKVATLDSWDKFGDGIIEHSFNRRINVHRTDEVNLRYEINDELAELVGWLSSDGYVNGKGQSIKFTNNNLKYLDRVEYLVTKYFPDIKPKRYKKGNGFDTLLTTGEKSYKNSLKDFMSSMDYEGHFPKAVTKFTRSQVISFLTAMYASDGYVYQRDNKNIEIGLSASNEYLYAQYCRELLNKLGIPSKIKKERMKNNKDGSMFHRVVTLGQRNVLKFGSIFSIPDKPIPTMPYSRVNSVELHDGEDGESLKYSNVISIKKLEGTYRVYDVTYPDKGWFICNGVKVHNSGKSETVSVVSGGMMVILPKLANTPMFAEDPRLQMFQNGLMVGIFAPSQRQAQTTYGKIRSKVESDRGLEILSDPEFNLRFTTSNGTTVALSNGSFVTAISASDGSNIEGESFHVIICEETQDISDFKLKKCLTGDTRVLLEDGSYKRLDHVVKDSCDEVVCFNNDLSDLNTKDPTEFYDNGVQPVYRLTLNNGSTIKATLNHQFLTFSKNTKKGGPKFRTVQDILDSQDKYSGLSIGVPDSLPFFSEERVNDYEIGLLLGHFIGDGCFTSTSPAFVGEPEKNLKLLGVMRSVLSEDLNMVEYNKDVTAEGTQSVHFTTPGNKKGSNPLKSLFKQYGLNNKLSYDKHLPLDTVYSKSFYKGLIEGLIETDGSIEMAKTKPRISYSSTSLTLINQIIDILLKFGIHAVYHGVSKAKGFGGENNKPLHFISIKTVKDLNRFADNFELFTKKDLLETAINTVKDKQDRNSSKHYPASMRFYNVSSIEYVGEEPTYCLKVEGRNFIANNMISSNSIHPMGAAYNASIIKIGTASTRKGDFYNVIQRNKKEFEDGVIRIRNHFEYDYKVVSKYNEKYRKYIEQEKRRLGERSDEFQLSYALTWILQRGMFIDIDEFEARNVDPNYDIVPYDKSATHVVGIDVGGASDSTVITVCEVDWTMPVVMESRTDEETGEEIVYQCYNTYVKAWHEIKDTPNFEEQYVEIMHFLSNFKIARLIIDATKESALADRINANTPYEVISYVFSSKSKSDLYKTFEREVNSGRVHVPGGEETKQSPEYLKCLAQLQDLEKSWRGAYMVVSHPPTKDGRDDFPDSLALAIWGCMDRGEVSDIRGSDRRAFINPNAKLFKERNQYTARRRR